MNRVTELEGDLRSLAMLQRGQMALNREQAEKLLRELLELHKRIQGFQAEMRAIMRAGLVPGADG